MSKLRIIIENFFLIWFIIRIIYLIFNLLIVKKRIISFGMKISILPILIESKKKLYLFIIFNGIFIFLIFLLLLILTKEILFLTACLFPVLLILRSFSIVYLSKYNGVYDKGIILGMFINYKQINSYEIRDKEEILLFLRNGKTVVITSNEKNKIIELLVHNQIQEKKSI